MVLSISRVFIQLIILSIMSRRTQAMSPKNNSVEKTLIRTLLDRYEKFGIVGRPVNSSDTLIKVNYGLALIQILDLDENKQVLRTNCWSRYVWNDILLQWNPDDYAGIKQIRVFPDQLWTPDITLYNFADERMKEHRVARVLIYSNGLLIWIPQALFKSTCSVEITYFPFDTQVCSMEFGSWTYDMSQLDLNWWEVHEINSSYSVPYIDFTDYVSSNEWETDGEFERKVDSRQRTSQIISRRKIRKVNVTDSYGRLVTKLYPILEYRVRLKRNPSFYVSILVIPCILLSCLTLVLFWLPPESPAKMMLGMNIFVAFFVLLLLLAESTPSAVKSFPLIGGYYCLNMVLITLSTFLAVIVINLYFGGDKRGPVPYYWRRIFIEGLGRILLVRQDIPLPPAAPRKRKGPGNNRRSQNKGINSTRLHRHAPPPLLYNKFKMTSNYLDTVEDLDPMRSQENGRTSPAPATTSSPWSRDGEFSNNLEDTNEPNPYNHSSSLADPEDSPILWKTNSVLEENVREIKRYVRLYVNRQKDKERRNQTAMEWRTVALILDRLFFIIYLVAISIAIITMLPRSSLTPKKLDDDS